MAKHIENIRKELGRHRADAIYLKSKTMKKYLDTMTGSGCQILIAKEKGYLLLDGRYVEEARQKERDLEIILTENIKEEISRIMKEQYNGRVLPESGIVTGRET